MHNTEVVEQFYQRLAQSDLEGALALLDDAFCLSQADSLPYGGQYTGASEITGFFGKFFAYWQEFSSSEVTYLEAGDTVVALSTARCVTRTGHRVDMPMVQVYRVKEGKLCAAQPFYFDTALLLK